MVYTQLLKCSYLHWILIFVEFFYYGIHGHVLNYDSVTICDEMAKKIECPENENIHVLQGFYGKWRNHDCRGESPNPDNLPTCSENRQKTTAIARDVCQGQNLCKLIADKSIHGEPCKKSDAYLYVTFFCMAPGQKLHHQKTEYNQEVVTVPSHGYVVEEAKHYLEKVRKTEEEENKKHILPPVNPSPEGRQGDIGDVDAQTKARLLSKQSQMDGEFAQKSRLPSVETTKSEKDKHVRSTTICNGQSKLIACLPEEAIRVNYAFYGKRSGRDCRGKLPYKDESPTCSALDAKNNVKNSCNGKQTCLLFADDNIYGKSLCPNVNKYLYLTYSCTEVPKDIPSTQVRFTPQEDLEEDAVSRSTEPVDRTQPSKYATVKDELSVVNVMLVL